MTVIFGDASLLEAALRFEAELARASAAEGLMSQAEATAIVEVCTPEGIDVAALAAAAAHAGTLAIPLVKLLREHAGTLDPSAADKVHVGATSQDVADTALMLQAKDAAALIDRDLARLADAAAALASTHAETKMLGRTLLQGALPITFGLKAAGWTLGLDAALARFRREAAGALVLQFGGAAGSLAGLDGRAFAVAERLAASLGLACPAMPWHSRREAVAGLAASLAVAAGAVGKIARDVSLLAQGEVAEAFEPRVAGRGGSSAMAHKRNPTGCQVALSAALRTPGLAATILAAMPQEHERGLGGWQTEAPVLADLFCLTHAAILAMLPVLEGLDINASAMAENLAAAGCGEDTGESRALVARALAGRGDR